MYCIVFRRKSGGAQDIAPATRKTCPVSDAATIDGGRRRPRVLRESLSTSLPDRHATHITCRTARDTHGDAQAVYQQIPTPVLLAFAVFIAHIIVITDTGAGVPIFFPIFKRCMRPFKPTVAYERLKSKYLIS